MFKSIKPIAISSACLGVAIFFCGCEINEGDVAAARDNVVEEQNETQQAREDAKREINEKEIDLDHARYTAKRPDYDEQSDVGEMEIELEETRQQMSKKIRKEERETKEAKADAELKESKLSAKNARDSFTADVETKWKTVTERIDAMSQELESLKGAEHQKLQTDIKLLEVKRDNLTAGLADMKSVEVLEWESQKEKVQQALKRLENSDESDE